MKKFLLRMYKSLKRIAKILLWIVGILVVVLIALWGYLAYLGDYKPYRGIDFSPALWDQSGKAMSSTDRSPGDILYGISPRCGMYDDLKTNYLKKGMHISEVEKLLGKSISTSYCMDKKVKCIWYDLGKCYANSFTMSSGILYVCVDENFKVIGVGRNRFDNEICNENIIHCLDGKEKCDCYKNDAPTSVECNFKVDRW